MVSIKIKVGNAMLECQTNDMKAIHEFSSVWGMLPQVCDSCKSQNIALNYKNIKSKKDGNVYKYYSIKCKDCTAEKSLHQKQDGGWYVVDDEKMEVYRADAVQTPVQQVQETFQEPAAPAQERGMEGNLLAGNDDSIPF